MQVLSTDTVPSHDAFAYRRDVLAQLPDKVRSVAQLDDPRVISGIIHVLKSANRWLDATGGGIVRAGVDSSEPTARRWTAPVRHMQAP
jgi:hypothetical protein